MPATSSAPYAGASPRPTRAAIVGISGTALAPEEEALLRAHPPAGVILFARNIADRGQVAALMASLRAVLPRNAVLMVDQEGGRVARLRPPHWRAHPPAARLGAIFERNPSNGLRAAYLTGALIGADCAEVGFDVACAPVLDLRLPETTDAIGDRAFSADPGAVARLGRAVADGLRAAGIQAVGKHAPGHGRARADSHYSLPVVDETDLAADIAPFAANADLPWMMTAHLVYRALDREAPATHSAAIISEVIRGKIGFSGLLCSDDLAMNALSGDPAERALRALSAGCDIALYCPGDADGTAAVLRSAPALTDAATVRLAAAAAWAADGRSPLDVAALADEREGLLT
jgi:beta-N-acetylhexosaminidase